jgi:hypothetical protein
MKILEIPITTMPWLRFPFHTSFTFAAYQLGLGYALFDFGYWLLRKTSLPLNFVFHTNELSVPIDDERIARQLGLALPLEDKFKICRHVMDKISADFNFSTTIEHAKRLQTEE